MPALRGVSVSGGIAVGRAVVLRTRDGWVARLPVSPDRLDQECARLRAAAHAASHKLASLSGTRPPEMGGELSSILSAHALMAIDPAFIRPVEKRIRREQINAEWALRTTAEELRERLAGAVDPVLSARGEDILQVARAIATELSAPREGFGSSSVDPGSILVADDLSPAQAARLDPAQFAGIALERGGVHSHTAIIARSFGVPAVVGVAGLLESAMGRRPMIVDGDRGIVEPSPSKPQLRRALERATLRREEEAARRRERFRRRGTTADGVPIALRANLELPGEAQALARYGAEGIGLFRSEFLFLAAADGPPSAEVQERVYASLAEECRPHPVVVRTYDLGGEKGWGPRDHDASAMGLRGVRHSLAHPELFRDQLRALVRASRAGKIRILLPMVSSPEEVALARAHLREVAAAEGLAPPELGVMIEVPSAVVLAAELARESDFFSIGTNDLAQYVLAAERSDPSVSAYYRPAAPAVLRMIKWAIDAARGAGRMVAVCGELAGDPLGACLLAGMGVRELSMSPVLIPKVDETLARFSSAELSKLAADALACVSADQVHSLGEGWASGKIRR
ncbi:MAG TPA: phosphoenolpyruvate--protein phosphotransferase [Thermoanaerobaculia bacterium]|nr:phosphoenolpyruvate--protein phosphotransferase [Thermoanaerobaculia bacterium]